jgi:hypothetical protein
MAGMIYLDALISRLRPHEFSSFLHYEPTVYSFSNLKPISEFVDFRLLSKPADLAEAQRRVNHNLGYFSSNYVGLAVILGVYSLLTNFWLLLDIFFVSIGMFTLKKLDGRDLQLGASSITTSQLRMGIYIIAVPIFVFASPLTTILWLVGANGVSILGHASFMDIPADQACSDEAPEDKQ